MDRYENMTIDLALDMIHGAFRYCYKGIDRIILQAAYDCVGTAKTVVVTNDRGVIYTRSTLLRPGIDFVTGE